MEIYNEDIFLKKENISKKIKETKKSMLKVSKDFYKDAFKEDKCFYESISNFVDGHIEKYVFNPKYNKKMHQWLAIPYGVGYFEEYMEKNFYKGFYNTLIGAQLYSEFPKIVRVFVLEYSLKNDFHISLFDEQHIVSQIDECDSPSVIIGLLAKMEEENKEEK